MHVLMRAVWEISVVHTIFEALYVSQSVTKPWKIQLALTFF